MSRLKDKNRIASSLAFIFAFIFLVSTGSCSRQMQLTIYNNSKNEVKMVSASASTLIPMNAGTMVLYPRDGDFRLESANGTKTYHISVFPPKKYVYFAKSGSFNNGNYTCKLQLESDLKMYLLDPSAVCPVEQFPDQPAGYPLIPK